jgi:hypothetical protein
VRFQWLFIFLNNLIFKHQQQLAAAVSFSRLNGILEWQHERLCNDRKGVACDPSPSSEQTIACTRT